MQFCLVTSFRFVKEQCIKHWVTYLLNKLVSMYHLKRNSGGATRDRTADLLRARQALSQLSYSPSILRRPWVPHHPNQRAFFVRQGKNQWSLQVANELIFNEVWRKKWWVWVDLNHRPHPYQGCALTNWATDPRSAYSIHSIRKAICVSAYIESCYELS